MRPLVLPSVWSVSYIQPSSSSSSFKMLPGFLSKRVDIEGEVVVGGDEGRGGGQVVQDRAACAPLRSLLTGGLPLGFHDFLELGIGVCAHLCGHACHARAGKAIEDYIARLRVMKDSAT